MDPLVSAFYVISGTCQAAPALSVCARIWRHKCHKRKNFKINRSFSCPHLVVSNSFSFPVYPFFIYFSPSVLYRLFFVLTKAYSFWLTAIFLSFFLFQYSIDDSLPFMLNIFLAQAYGVAGTIAITCYGLPWFIILLLPLSLIYYYIQNYYRRTSRYLFVFMFFVT
jgi:hypothetical protein